MYFDQRCMNCGASGARALCGPCEQDRLIEQAQLTGRTPRAGMRCTD